MHTIFRNFLSMIRRYKTAAILNVLGLSIAFSVFYIVIAQVMFDWEFDSFHKDRDCIFRMELEYEERKTPNLSFPQAHHMGESSPHIKEFGILTNIRGGNVKVKNDSSENEQNEVYASFAYVTKGYPKVFTFNMYEGQVDSIMNPENAIIPLSLAKKVFGERKSYLGEKLEGANWYLTIQGVYHDFPKNSMMQNIVYQIPAEYIMNRYLSNWSEWSYFLYLKLDKPESASEVFANYEWPGDGNKYDYKIKLRPLKDIYYAQDVISFDIQTKGNKNVTNLLFSIAVMIVLIAGINFMNFATSLVPVRIKSVNTRKVMGCATGELRLSFLMESLLTAFLAFLLAILIILIVSITPLTDYMVSSISFRDNIGLLAITFGIAIITGILSAVYPAFYITSFPPALVLSGSFGLSPRGKAFRNVLIGVQFIVSLIAIIVVLFMNMQNRFMQYESPGFDKEQIAIVNLTKKIRADQADVFISKLKEKPFVEDVAFTENTVGTSDGGMGWGRPFKDGYINFDVIPATPNYLDVMGISVVEGRNFREEDQSNAKGVFIFNQVAKNKFGLELHDQIGGDGEIIGFMPDIRHKSFRYEVTPMAFFVWGTENWGIRDYIANIRLFRGTNTHQAARSIENLCKELDPDFSGEIYFYDDVYDNLYKREKGQSTLVMIFSLLAIFISIVGVFGLVIFETQSRRKEIGIRKIYGSTIAQILMLVSRNYVRIVLYCFIIAAPIAWYVVYLWLQNFAYHTPIYIWVFFIGLLLLLLIVSATVVLQSWRTAKENPKAVIQNE